MLASFNGTWDWTAIGTLALAIVTGVSLAFAWGSLKQTKLQIMLGQEQLQQTQREIELSRREVEEAHRPVVIPVVIARPPDLGARSVSGSRRTFPGRPSVVKPGVLAVPIQNIGSGPALGVVASIERLDDQGDLYRGPIEHRTPGRVAGLGKDDTVSIEIDYHGWEERWNFQLRLEYEDVADKRWVTICRYIAEHGRYEDLTIEMRASFDPRP
jgi:hypothetical protein